MPVKTGIAGFECVTCDEYYPSTIQKKGSDVKLFAENVAIRHQHKRTYS